MKIYRTSTGCVLENNNQFYAIEHGTEAASWDALITREDLRQYLENRANASNQVETPNERDLKAPIGSQEVWAAGVTYYRSRDARMEESKVSGGGDFYDRVYSADRPELFFKATPHRVVGPGQTVAIREDAQWSVPEPELTLLISPGGKITGYTIGNDMSSRDIEGENPLYLPQAKVYDRSCALGPCILVSDEPISPDSEIQLQINRNGAAAFSGSTTLRAMKRELPMLVAYLYRSNSFPSGCFLLTGTGVVPPDDFSLRRGDEIRISISGIGTLVNTVG